MDKFFGALGFMLANTDKIQIIWYGAVLLTMLILAVLHHRLKHYEREMKLWKKLCLIPLLITTVHYFVYVWGVDSFLRRYTPMYLTALLALLPAMCAGLKKSCKAVSVITGALSVVFAAYFFTSSTKPHNFTRKSYTKSFHAMVREMDRSYVLKEWKDIDFYALEDKYMPLVEEAEQEKDPAKLADAVTMFCNELHDNHVRVGADYDFEKYSSSFMLRDYGFSMVQLDSGEVIAVCTDAAVNELGINDGTVITKWDGEPVLQAAEKIGDCGQPVKANDEREILAELAGTGGDTVKVSFIDSTGREQTAELTALENEHTYDDALNAFLHCPEDMRELINSNFSAKMLDDKCGYLVLSAETTGSSIRDDISFYTGKSKWARELFRERLRDLRDQGMEYLVVDMRNNVGGCGPIGYELCSLLSDKDIYAMGLGVRKNGGYKRLTTQMIRSDGEFADLKVVVLTNCQCISAGDSTALCLSRLPNVTLAGITDPNGSGQITGGCCVLSGGIVSVNYPIGLTLNENDEPDIDTRADRISRDPVEVRIPLDYDAAMRIFRDKEDHELDWAVKYLENE
ncbi:S41 family peptidase [Ruminococcus flavefaciens]|uniref:S41 family peptidase n=1 Tax=Ruminococcus flavefaciens TaxID=1265 RepID=UPI0026F2D8E7|nr:S41 family peptidase [Ruminococcus flavefaciens]